MSLEFLGLRLIIGILDQALAPVFFREKYSYLAKYVPSIEYSNDIVELRVCLVLLSKLLSLQTLSEITL